MAGAARTTDPLAAVRKLDSAGHLEAALALPDHLRDALWRIETATLRPIEGESAGAMICGVGGSAVGGDLAAAAIGDRLTRPVTTVRGYALPSWATPEALVLCSSYSGDTEEALACYEAGGALGARRIAATTGGELAEAARRDGVPVIGLPAGLAPRSAVAYMVCCAAEVAALAGAGPRLRSEIDSSAAHLEQRRDSIVERAVRVAGEIGEHPAVIYGADLTAPVAYRWKTQLNENAKAPAFSSTLPEADHNEIAAWPRTAAGPRFAAVLIADRDQHPRVRRRFELTAELIAGGAERVVHLETDGETRMERLLDGVMVGDLASLLVAARRGVDPGPIDPIERLKAEL